MFYKYLSLFFILNFSFSSDVYARLSCDWPFQTSITINETSGTTTSDYSVKLTLTGSTGGTLSSEYDWSSNGEDLRVFDDINGATPIDFSIASWNQATKTAEVWITFPTFTANSSHTIYIYYGNDSVATADSGTPPTVTYVPNKIKFHTRYNNDQINDPDSLAEAKALFDSQDDSNTAYGCTHPNSYAGIQNSSQNAPGGARIDFIAYSTALFTVPTSGTWGVRYGADYGLGGGLYINGIPLDERWEEDLWWSNSWNSSDVLEGITTLSAGEHLLEIIGAEGGNDGGLTIQFYRGSDNNWQQDATSLGITIRSEACPVVRHTIQYGAHDICSTDLSLTSTDGSNQTWLESSSNTLSLTVNNLDASSTATSNSKVTFLLPSGISYSSATGSNWSCAESSGTVTCSYASDILANASSSTLQITTSVSATAGNSLTIDANITGSKPDLDNTINNSISFNIDILSSTGIPASCSQPKPGLLARFFDISGYGTSNINSAATYQALIDARANINYIQGQTIYPNINGSGNPFTTVEDNFVVIFEGYIYSSTATRARFGVDGDDAVEAWVNGSIVSAFYGLHAAEGSAQDTSGRITINAGFNEIEFRLQEYTGGDQYDFYWRPDFTTSYVIIPANSFYHCAGDAEITIESTLTIQSDPINGSSYPKAIPEAIMTYKVDVENIGSISADYGSTELVQKIDSEAELFVGDFISSGPIEFSDGTSTSNSGLSYLYTSINNNGDNISFSSDGINFNHPVTNSGGYDSDITHFKLNLQGAFKPTMDGVTPTFSYEYQVRVK